MPRRELPDRDVKWLLTNERIPAFHNTGTVLANSVADRAHHAHFGVSSSQASNRLICLMVKANKRSRKQMPHLHAGLRIAVASCSIPAASIPRRVIVLPYALTPVS